MRSQRCNGVHGRRRVEAERRRGGRSLPPPPGEGRVPTRAGSGRDLACAAEGAPDCKDVAGPKLSDSEEGAAPPAGQSLGRAGSPLGWDPAQIQPARPEARHEARALPGQSPATQGRPSLSLPGEARVGPGAHSNGVLSQIQPARQEARQAAGAPGCMGVAGPKPSDEGEGPASLTWRSPGRAWSPLGCGQGQIQPVH